MKKKKKGKTKNTVLYNFISGIIIGIGFIIPGVSGGVLAVLLCIYDQIIFAISNLRKNLSKNIAFLFTVLLGVVIGTVLFSKVLIYLLESKEFAIKYVFVGLIIGGIPSLVTTIKNKSEKSIIITYTILAFLISIGLIYV